MAKHTSKDSDVELGFAESKELYPPVNPRGYEGEKLEKLEELELKLPEADYGAEVRGMNAVLVQMRSLIGNLEGLLFSLMVHSHKPPPKPEKMVVMEDGDIVEKEVPRLVRGSLTGICRDVEREEDVRTTADEQAATTPSNR